MKMIESYKTPARKVSLAGMKPMGGTGTFEEIAANAGYTEPMDRLSVTEERGPLDLALRDNTVDGTEDYLLTRSMMSTALRGAECPKYDGNSDGLTFRELYL